MSEIIHKMTSRILVLLLLASVFLGACAPAPAPTEQVTTETEAAEAPTAEEQAADELEVVDGLRVAVIWGSLGNDFNVRGHDAAVATLEEMGVEVLDNNAGGDRNRQVDLIENAIQLQVDGMVMGDVAAEIIDPVIQQARDAGIPVVTVQAYSSAANNDVVLNEWLNGWEAALLAKKYLGDKPGNVVVAYEPGFRPIEVRFASSGAAMPFLKADYNVVATVNAHWPNTMPEAKAQMEAFLTQYPNDEDIDLAFATYDLEAIGMAQAIEEAGRDIPVVGFDASPDMLDWIARGSVIKGTVASDPPAMGRQAAVNLIKILQGETLARKTYAPVIAIDVDNVEAFITP
jgi:ribose transport system substrate-binding protein